MAKQPDSKDDKATGKGNEVAERPSSSVALAGESSGSVLGFAGNVVVVTAYAVATLISKLWNALTADGTLAAAGRQGADELGAALKAFPDSIQTQETGTVWSPTQGEIAASRSQGKHTGSYMSFSNRPHPWPSEIAREGKPGAGDDHGHDHGQDAGNSL